jgi:hypothetical protein
VGGGRHTANVMAGRVPAIFALADEARMAGTRPAMTKRMMPIGPDNSPPAAYPKAYGSKPMTPQRTGSLPPSALEERGHFGEEAFVIGAALGAFGCLGLERFQQFPLLG